MLRAMKKQSYQGKNLRSKREKDKVGALVL